MTTRQKAWTWLLCASATGAGVLITTYFMVAWYGRIGGICG